jgi:hypothetical protein
VEAFATMIEASALGGFARDSSWAYPLANLVHLFGLVLLVGSIGILDLRLIGAFTTLPLVPLARALTPLGVIGLALMALSGPVLFAADASALVRSATFGAKLVLIAIALMNALAFRWLWSRREGEPTMIARGMAAASLILWLAVATLGRLIAYN